LQISIEDSADFQHYLKAMGCALRWNPFHMQRHREYLPFSSPLCYQFNHSV